MRFQRQAIGAAIALMVILSLPSVFAGQSTRKGQEATPAHQHQHQHQHAPATQGETAKPPVLPPAQEGETRLRLEDLEKIALESNPTLAQAAASVGAAEGRKLQSGLYPNPTIGATGDENTPGPIIRGGEFGFFVEQQFVTAGKLGKSRNIAEQERLLAETTAQAQKQRVLNAVRSLYYEALGADRRVQVQTQLATLSQQAVKISKELTNVGAADQPDLLESEIEADRADVNLAMAKTTQARVWRELAAVVGSPSLQPAPLEGNLEDVPRLELESAIAKLFSESPEIRTSEVTIAREEAALRRAKVEKVPDIVARGGLRYNRELLELGGKPVGLEGFFDVGVEIPFFNRNQGNVAAARANLERAQREVERVKLSLRMRMARAYKEYQDSLINAEKYRAHMIPRAKKAYDLYLNNFRQMAAAYPQVLIAQRNLFQLQENYITALVTTWRSAVEIQGLLLAGGLDAPGTMETEITSADKAEKGGPMEEH
ncbi:MAG: TolC family protein [Acidobacteria bacterium]|nr:TolC family protein [Acidobacteriota bacterium]